MNFLVMGDWGGSPSKPYTTRRERTTASGMNEVGGTINARFALALGDNFYYNGVADVNDPRFEETFESAFTGANLQGENFFRVLLGNHDHYGNASAQIAYSDVSERWHIPGYFWDFEETYGKNDEFKLHVIMIDTVILAGGDEAKHSSLAGSKLPGPRDRRLFANYMKWIENKLKNSDADHIIVAGHFPVWSICEHGPTNQLVSDLKPLLEQYNVSAYLAGHDHCAEVIVDSGVAYHGVGSANFNVISQAHRFSIPHGSLKWHVGVRAIGGFASISMDGEDGGMKVVHHSGDGGTLYEAEKLMPKK